MVIKIISKRGFSLIELLVIISIVALFAVLTIPLYRDFSQHLTADTVIRALERNLAFARSTAIAHEQIVAICPIGVEADCGSNWSNGYWIFYQDTSTSTPHILRRIDDIKGQLQWRGFPNKQVLMWTADGKLNEQNGTFTYCPANGDEYYARTLIISKTGRMRFSRQDDRVQCN